MTENTAIATLPEKFEDQIAYYTPQFKAALPAHLPLDRFKRVLITAINQQPELAQADRRSLFNSCVKAATDGLFPDGREAALVIFNSKNKDTGQWEKRVQYMPMIAGVRKRMRNSGEVKSSEAHVIYEKDQFSYELGDHPQIVHKPLILGDRGKPIGAYAVINLSNGEVLREVMSFQEIEQARAVSRAKDSGPWVTWWGEMARKTVLRRCAKAAPMSADLDDILKRDDEIEPDGAAMLDAGGMAGRPTRAAQVEHRAAPDRGPPGGAGVINAKTTQIITDTDDQGADQTAETDAAYDLVDPTGSVESSHKTADDWAKQFGAAIGQCTNKKELGYIVANGEAWLTIRDEVEDDNLVGRIDTIVMRAQKDADAANAPPAAKPAAPAAPAAADGAMVLPMKDGKPNSTEYLVACQNAVKAIDNMDGVVAFLVREIENLKKVLPGTKRSVMNNVALTRWIALGGKQEEWDAALKKAAG